MKKQKTWAYNNAKKRRILIGCAIGGSALIGFGAAGGAVLGMTSCAKHKPEPVDEGLIIDSTIDNFLIENDDTIYFSETNYITSHNTLLDLQAYANSQNYSGNIFTIKGTINFGFLIGFDQDVTLKGRSGSLVSITNSTTWSFGVLVGSANPLSSGTYNYSGQMDIQNSTSFLICSTDTVNGVCFPCEVASGSAETIAGTFTIYSPQGLGVAFQYETQIKSTQHVTGTFTILGDTTGSSAWGVNFGGPCYSDITIDGTFTISSTTKAVGVEFGANICSSSTQIIDGTFTIYSSDTTGTFGAAAVWFNSASDPSPSADYSTEINGTFTCYGSKNAYVAYFNAPQYFLRSISFGGVFTISATDKAYGLFLYASTTAPSSLSFAASNKFVLITPTSGTVYSSTSTLGAKDPKMKVYGFKDTDGTSSTDYATYIPDTNLSLVTASNIQELSVEVHSNPNVYFFMYYATTTDQTKQSSTKIEMRTALLKYIARSDASVLGKEWISEILTAF